MTVWRTPPEEVSEPVRLCTYSWLVESTAPIWGARRDDIDRLEESARRRIRAPRDPSFDLDRRSAERAREPLDVAHRLRGAAHRPCMRRVVWHERSTVNLVGAVYLCGTEHNGVVQFLMAVSSKLGHW